MADCSWLQPQPLDVSIAREQLCRLDEAPTDYKSRPALESHIWWTMCTWNNDLSLGSVLRSKQLRSVLHSQMPGNKVRWLFPGVSRAVAQIDLCIRKWLASINLLSFVNRSGVISQKHTWWTTASIDPDAVFSWNGITQSKSSHVIDDDKNNFVNARLCERIKCQNSLSPKWIDKMVLKQEWC